MGKVSKLRFWFHLRALPFRCLAKGYRLLSFRPLLLWGWPEPLTLHLPHKILWLMDGIRFKATFPLHNRWLGATPLLPMGIRGQVPLIPKLAHLVPQLGPSSKTLHCSSGKTRVMYENNYLPSIGWKGRVPVRYGRKRNKTL